MGEIKFITSLAFITAFSIAIIMYMVTFSSDNGSVFTITDDGQVNSTNYTLQSNTLIWLTNSNESSDLFSRSEIESGDDNFKTGGAFKNNSRAGLSDVLTIAKYSFKNIFGQEFDIIFNIFSGLLAIISILLIWKTWGGRNPE